MNKTSYEKEGLNSLNELFEKLIVCSEKQDKEGTLRIVSSLNDEEKDYLYTWATEQGKLDKVAGIVVKAEMDKKAFDINCRFKKTLCEALVQNGYCLEGDPDVYNSDSFPFTDNKYINGEVIFDTRKVQLKARDAENRKYEKTIDYSSVGDLMESINHFRKDIEETFNKPEVVEEVVKEEPFDILNDKNFLKEIGADWVTNLIKKKAEEDVENNVWIVEKTSAPTIDDQLTLDIFYVVNKNTHVVAHDAGFEPFFFPTQEDAQKHADKLNSQKEASQEENIEKKAEDEETSLPKKYKLMASFSFDTNGASTEGWDFEETFNSKMEAESAFKRAIDHGDIANVYAVVHSRKEGEDIIRELPKEDIYEDSARPKYKFDVLGYSLYEVVDGNSNPIPSDIVDNYFFVVRDDI